MVFFCCFSVFVLWGECRRVYGFFGYWVFFRYCFGFLCALVKFFAITTSISKNLDILFVIVVGYVFGSNVRSLLLSVHAVKPLIFNFPPTSTLISRIPLTLTKHRMIIFCLPPDKFATNLWYCSQKSEQSPPVLTTVSNYFYYNFVRNILVVNSYQLT